MTEHWIGVGILSENLKQRADRLLVLHTAQSQRGVGLHSRTVVIQEADQARSRWGVTGLATDFGHVGADLWIGVLEERQKLLQHGGLRPTKLPESPDAM